ncbi:MAG: MarR family winged helix-turn-helix transcriptional regulator [Phototrophicaceae bacterium]|jgi:DNA-binding MarR family transcriptional regulator
MPDLTPEQLAEELLEMLPTLGRLMFQHFNDSSDDHTMIQVRVLHHLAEQPITTSELAKIRKVSLQSTSVMVQGLVDRGWVVRTPNPQDRRQQLLEVTPDGMAYAELAKGRMIAYLAEFWRDLTPEELQAAQICLPALRHIFTEKLRAEYPNATPK